jgi:hypothetical protein
MKNAVFWDVKPGSYLIGDTLSLHYKAQPVNAVWWKVTVYCKNRTENTSTARTSQETHYVSGTETNRLMLFGKRAAAYYEDHIRVRTSQEIQYISITEPKRLMLFGETAAVCCEKDTNFVYPVVKYNSDNFNFKAGGIYSNHCALYKDKNCLIPDNFRFQLWRCINFHSDHHGAEKESDSFSQCNQPTRREMNVEHTEWFLLGCYAVWLL